jgi:hypothetical protein
VWAPQVVESEELEATGGESLVSEQRDAEFTRDRGNPLGDVRHIPVKPVVVVAENADGPDTPMG